MRLVEPAAIGNLRAPRVARQRPEQVALAFAALARAKRPVRGPQAGASGRAGAAREAPRPWHYAKHVSAYLAHDADTRVSRRHVRHAQREVLWGESRIERVRKCGRVPVTQGGHVTIKDNAGVAHYAGLATCGSIWACPVCSAKIRNHRSLDISTGAANWDLAGNTVYLLTLTMPHDFGMPLARLIPVIADGFRGVISGRPWVRLRDQLGIAGTIRSMEVTHGANGWHPHLHVLVFIEGSPDAAGLAALTLHVRRAWARQITAAGFRVPNSHGVDIQRCYSAAEAGQYIAKTQDGRSAGNELARGDLKSGRNAGRTPFEILDDFRWTGDSGDLALWHEYERATKGHQAISWSDKLRERLDLAAEELSNEDVAAAEVGGEDIAIITNPQWKRVVAIPGLAGHLLDRAEQGGIDAVNEALRAHKVGVARDPNRNAVVTALRQYCDDDGRRPHAPGGSRPTKTSSHERAKAPDAFCCYPRPGLSAASRSVSCCLLVREVPQRNAHFLVELLDAERLHHRANYVR